MYYATFKGIGISDVAEFETAKERDEWVDFKDDFSLTFGTTKENASFERKKLTNKREIEGMVNNNKIKVVVDEFNLNQRWYLRSIMI